MTMKQLYICDICREEIKDTTNLFGVYFKNMTNFELSGHKSTDGQHICYRCAKQLKEQLNAINFENL